MAHANGWQAFVNHLAEASRKDDRRRRQEFVGRMIWLAIWVSAATFAVGTLFKYLGWI